MERKTVVIDNDVYELTAVNGDISGAVCIELLSDIAPILTSFFDGDISEVNKELRTSVNSEKVMRIFSELINFNVLRKNNELVKDWKVEFSCKPLTLFRLGYEALRFNCEDFFTFISGFVKEKSNGQNLKELIKSLNEEGVELPPIFSLLMQTGEETQEEEPQK